MPPKNRSRRPSKKTARRSKKPATPSQRRKPWHAALFPALLPVLVGSLRREPAMIASSRTPAQLHRNYCTKYNLSIDRGAFDRILAASGIRFASGAVIGPPTPNGLPTDGHGQEAIVRPEGVDPAEFGLPANAVNIADRYAPSSPEPEPADDGPDNFTVTNEGPASLGSNEAALAALANSPDAMLAHTGDPNAHVIIPR